MRSAEDSARRSAEDTPPRHRRRGAPSRAACVQARQSSSRSLRACQPHRILNAAWSKRQENAEMSAGLWPLAERLSVMPLPPHPPARNRHPPAGEGGGDVEVDVLDEGAEDVAFHD